MDHTKDIKRKLKQLGEDYDALKANMIHHLENIEELLQEKQTSRNDAICILKNTTFTLKSISSDLGISRTVLYNHEQLLKRYIEYSAEEYAKDDPLAFQSKLAKEKKELQAQINALMQRDVEMMILKHQIGQLTTDLEAKDKEIERLHKRVQQLSVMQQHENKDKAECGKVIQLVPQHDIVRGSVPDDFNLGISIGEIGNLSGALDMADACNTHTVMVYCNNEDFPSPDLDRLKSYSLVIHGPLNINLGSDDEKKRTDSVERIKRIIHRCNGFPESISALVLHPGSGVNEDYLIKSMDELLPLAEFPIALEFMAGKGNELLSSVESIKTVIDSLEHHHYFSICLDTCHMWDAGYDFSSLDSLYSLFLNDINLDIISVIHVNDSKNKLGSHKDRHANIGEGTMPLDSLAKFTKSVFFKNIPKVLETPQQLEQTTFIEEMSRLISGE